MFIGKKTVLKIDPLCCPAKTAPEYKSYFWGAYEKFNCKSYID